jgi:glutamyl/glutaminyl-tRNA synthetase
MEITHVLRAEEWLPSTPRHLLLYDALGYAAPQFVHLPMILGSDRAKLSKRHGAVSLLEYRRQGYLPEAMFNFLGLLGWSLDDHTEIISREEFIHHFSLERIVKNPAIFDVEKLKWMNGVYFRMKSNRDLAKAIRKEIREEGEQEKRRLFRRRLEQRVEDEVRTMLWTRGRPQLHEVPSLEEMLKEQQRDTRDFLDHAWLLDRTRKEQINRSLDKWDFYLSQANYSAISASLPEMKSVLADGVRQARQLANAKSHSVAPLIKERIKLLTDVVPSTAFFFVEGPLTYDLETLLGKRFADNPKEAQSILKRVNAALPTDDRWQRHEIESVLRALADKLGVKAGDLFMLVRVAVTGQTATPPLFETMEVLGRERCLARLRDALGHLT